MHLQRVALLVIVLSLHAGPPLAAQITTLAPPDSVDARSFGTALALDGNRAIVGAPGEDVCGPQSGAAYIYERDPEWGQWTATARLTPEPCRENAFFGSAVDIRGSRVLISASSEFFATPESNAAFVFEQTTDTTWAQTATLTGDLDQQEGPFGADLVLTDTRAFVSTTGDFQGQFGGAVYVFRYDAQADTWGREARLTSANGSGPGRLGGQLEATNTRIVAAAPTYFERTPGSVYVFERDAEARWHATTVLTGFDDFFIPLSLDNDQLLVGERRAGDDESGQATLYTRAEAGAWTEGTTLVPRRPFADGAFGSAVAVHGPWALVTGYDEQLQQDVNIDRVVYVFRRNDAGTWQQHTIIDVGRVGFGTALDLDQDIALVSWVGAQGNGLVYAVTLQ
ncbi:FG-GAP repeat protein [Longimonas halophila]|nr:FG-GAP repeat protein [Longimonas halophila]